MSLPMVDGEKASRRAVEPVQDSLHEAEIIPFVTPEVDALGAERVHGQYERVLLFSDEFVKMSQVRGEKNKVGDELKDSILRTGLINSPDVAHLTEETLVEYIEFVNEVWGSSTKIEEFAHQRREDGTYYLVIAGGSRHEAITVLEEEGKLGRFPIESKVHNVTSPEQIVQIQLDENIHSQPPRERRAIAIVETYEWGVRTGKWSNQKEFLAVHETVGKTVLSEALAFSDIPPHIRSFVLAGRMSYNAGLEIGKAAGDLKRYLYFKAGVTPEKSTEKQHAKVSELIIQRLTVETNNIIKLKLNSSAAERRVRGWRAQMDRAMIESEAARQEAEDNAMFALDVFSPDEILDEELKRARAELAEFLREYGRAPSTAAQELILLNSAVVPTDLIETTLRDHQVASEKASRILAAGSLHSNDVAELVAL